MRPRLIVLGDSTDLPGVLPLGDSFDEDGAAVLRAPEAALQALAKLIAEHPGFLSRQQLIDPLRRDWDDIEGGKRVASYAVALDGILRRTRSTISRFFSSFEAGLKERARFSDAEKQELVRRSHLFVLEESALARQWQAETLATETGRTLEDLQLRCTLYPIFDNDRHSVMGMLPLVSMDLEARDTNGLPVLLEVQMTPADLDDLADKVANAQKELEALRSKLAGAGMPVPQLEESDDEDDDDDGEE